MSRNKLGVPMSEKEVVASPANPGASGTSWNPTRGSGKTSGDRLGGTERRLAVDT